VPVGRSRSTSYKLITVMAGPVPVGPSRSTSYKLITVMAGPVPVGPSMRMLLLSSFSSYDVESSTSLAWRTDVHDASSSLPVMLLLLGPSELLLAPVPGVGRVVMPAMCSSSTQQHALTCCLHHQTHKRLSQNTHHTYSVSHKEEGIFSWLPRLCIQNLLFTQPRWQPRTYFVNNNIV